MRKVIDPVFRDTQVLSGHRFPLIEHVARQEIDSVNGDANKIGPVLFPHASERGYSTGPPFDSAGPNPIPITLVQSASLNDAEGNPRRASL